MARTKSIETDVLINEITSMHLDAPGRKIKIPDLGIRLRNKGYAVQDHTLRRNKEAREYIDKLNEDAITEDMIVANSYHSIDVDELFRTNRSTEKLKKAVATREGYYQKVAAAASNITKEFEKLKKENTKLIRENEELIEKLAKNEKVANNAEIRKRELIIKKLYNIFSDYVYPDMAAIILEKEGILDAIDHIVNDRKQEEQIVTRDTDISSFTTDIANELLSDFEVPL